ncbi:MAG: hypothetical protein LLG37_02910 [Spirochaetia bacterium]|nr:hypothetical protein [Spirochaetia bacterium]
MMKKHMARFFLFPVLTALACVPVMAAQSGMLGGAYTDNGISTRALGMGSAFTAVSDDGNASWWNPSAMAFLGKTKSVSFTYVPEMITGFTGISDIFISYAQGDTMGFGALGGSVRYLSARFEADYTGDDEYKWAEYIAAISWAYRIDRYIGLSKFNFPKLAIGLNAKYFGSSTDLMIGSTEVSASGFGVDASITLAMKDNFRIAVMAKNVFSQVKWQSGTQEAVPYDITAGLYYGITNELGVAFDLKTTQNDTSLEVASCNAGAEYRFDFGKNAQIQSAVARAGVQYSPFMDTLVLCGGASVGMETFSVDYAIQKYMRTDLNDMTHRFGLTVNF